MGVTGTTTTATTTRLHDLFVEHHRDLVRLAGLLIDDAGGAEEVVQEAYVKLAGKLDRLRQPDAALFYLRRTVMNQAKSRLRRRRTAERHQHHERPTRPDAAPHADPADRLAVLAAMRGLATRQQQCLVLRYYGGLTDEEIARSLGISLGSAKTHVRRGLAALAERLEDRR